MSPVMKRIITSLRFIFCATVLCMMGSHVFGTSYAWTSPVSGNWASTANWTRGAPATGPVSTVGQSKIIGHAQGFLRHLRKHREKETGREG